MSTAQTIPVTCSPASELQRRLAGSPYQGYAYCYPHKTSYRTLTPPIALSDAWSPEPKRALELYVHVPFCAMRCGFCNLFTTVNANDDTVARMLSQLEIEMNAAASALGRANFKRIAVGGGTPTVLDAPQLEQLFDILDRTLGAVPGFVPTSVEVSPETVTGCKLGVLKTRGVERISIGVQSFFDTEARALGRPQRRAVVERALDLIVETGFATLNIDLIYGAPGQTIATWLASVDTALAWQPDELFLYPLYVRQLTGLARMSARTVEPDMRLEMYRVARERLLTDGFEQVNMRCFRRVGARIFNHARHQAPTDGTLGIGCGARSTTQALHYSNEYAVGRASVKEILSAYLSRSPEGFRNADFGTTVSLDDRKRRHVLLALLEAEGMAFAFYQNRFGTDALEDMPELDVLVKMHLATTDERVLRLTEAGIERADVIGPWLYSIDVSHRMEGYQWR